MFDPFLEIPSSQLVYVIRRVFSTIIDKESLCDVIGPFQTLIGSITLALNEDNKLMTSSMMAASCIVGMSPYQWTQEAIIFKAELM